MSKNTETAEDQHVRFVEKARSLGCDEDEAAFDEKLKGIARVQEKGRKSDATPPLPD